MVEISESNKLKLLEAARLWTGSGRSMTQRSDDALVKSGIMHFTNVLPKKDSSAPKICYSPEMTRKIEPRYGAEVYVGEKGHVCIRQSDGMGNEETIVLHPEEIPELILHLQATYEEALDSVPES